MGAKEPPEAAGGRAGALVVMGVSGSGKSTVAELLAQRLGWEMIEGDTLHPPANVEKMRRGIPLDDADRAPWLERIGEELKARKIAGRSLVLTCSALKRVYRAQIVAARPDVCFVYLKGGEDLINRRVSARHHQFMPASLLHSQFETLEEPTADEPVITVNVADSPEDEAQAVLDALAARAAKGG